MWTSYKKNLKLALKVFPIFLMSILYSNCTPTYKIKDFTNESSQSSTLPETPAQMALKRGIESYQQKCMSCHGAYDSSSKKGLGYDAILGAVNTIPQMSFLKSVSAQTLQDIGYALTFTSLPSEPSTIPNGTPAIAKTWDGLKERSCAPTGLGRDIRILDRSQFHDIVFDLFGYNLDVSSLPDDLRDYYRPDALSSGSGILDLIHLDALYNLSEKTGSYVGTNINSVASRFSNCDISTKNCQDQVATQIVSRLFRKNLDLTDADLSSILIRFSGIQDFKVRIKNILTASLMMPRFLYVVEYQKGFRAIALNQDTLRSIDDYELASRLSFLIWNSAPDSELLGLAQTKSLSQPTVLSSQVQRLLADARSQRFIKKFSMEWLNLSGLDKMTKNTVLVPGFSSSLMEKLKTETTSVFLNMFLQNTDFREAFTTNKTFVDGTLAKHYGISGVTGTSFISATRPESELSGGILSHGSISAVTSDDATDPIHRGIYQYRRFLCGKIGDPPPSAALVVINGTKLEQLHARAQMTNCASCHSKFEAIGYPLERLNPLGQFRLKDESGSPTGQPIILENGTTIATLRELGQQLSQDPAIGFCLSQNLTKFAFSGSFQQTDSTQCQTENTTYKAFIKGNHFKSYVEALVQSALFNRKLEAK